ncbi:MAG: hypothetical protein ABIH82_04915 [Candidatus Woesearchaeota archaeon]
MEAQLKINYNKEDKKQKVIMYVGTIENMLKKLKIAKDVLDKKKT